MIIFGSGHKYINVLQQEININAENKKIAEQRKKRRMLYCKLD
jgi:hypothetical protein